jgi:uncharacterized membrane protein
MNFFTNLWAYILVFVLAATPFFEAIAIVPIAVLGGLSIIPVILLALIGNLLTVYMVIIYVDRIKKWRKKKKGEKVEKKNKRKERAEKIWKKYGLPGLAIIGPFFVGSHLTALMSITLGGTKKGVAAWISASLVVWCIALAILAHLGFDFFNSSDRGFLNNLFND